MSKEQPVVVSCQHGVPLSYDLMEVPFMQMQAKREDRVSRVVAVIVGIWGIWGLSF